MNMATKFDDLDAFVVRMKAKFQAKAHKHQDNPNAYDKDGCKSHFIREIAELFNLSVYGAHSLRLLLNFRRLKPDELVDVANMVWVMDYIVRHPDEGRR